jgi:hypothetical protein
MTDLFAEDHQPDLRAEIEAKWKDKPLDEVLKAKIESDLYIKTLERQKDELRTDYLKQREELLAKAKFEELIDRYEKAPKDLLVAPPQANEESPKYNPKDVEDIVLKKIQESKISDIETQNFHKVENKLRERFGDNFKSVLKEQQATLGLSTEDVNALAKKSPEAFFRIMDLNEHKAENFQAPPRSNQRNDNFAPKGQPKRDYAFYQEMKKTNPKLYLDKQIAVQMHNDVISMGEAAFYGQS